MSDEEKTIDEAMEGYNRLHNMPIDVTDITHEEFVAGVERHDWPKVH